jgi:signal transduction histidine kinase
MVAASIAHEINNPLSAVLANLELALAELDELGKHHPLPNELWEELRDVRGGAERIRQLARDLGVFSRQEEGEKTRVDVRRVLDSTLRLTWNEVRHRARLVKRYETVAAVTANESRLGQVFLNLIVNAAQGMPEGHSDANEIRISTGMNSDGRVLVTVSDTGPLAAARRDFTSSAGAFAVRPPQVGAALGLSICQRIVASLGGELALDREEGVGNVVRVALPPAPTDQVA